VEAQFHSLTKDATAIASNSANRNERKEIANIASTRKREKTGAEAPVKSI
jgi:hypothetical protein